MLLSVLRPYGGIVSITGSAFVDSNGAVLLNGNPGETAKFLWDSGSQTLTTTIAINVLFPAAFIPRLAGLMGTTLPVGTKIVIGFKRVGDSDYSYQAATIRVVERPWGQRVAWIEFPAALDAIIAVQFLIFNDVNGSYSIVASSEQLIGELWCGQGLIWNMTPDWGTKYNDPTTSVSADLGNQIRQRGTISRTCTMTPGVMTQAEVFQGAMEQGFDYEKLIAATDRGQLSVIAQRHKDPSGALASDLLNRTASFGLLKQSATNKHLAGLSFGPGEWTHTETPIPA